MKIKIDNCPKCGRDTLQAEAEITQGETCDLSEDIKIIVWFCSLCGSYWQNVGKVCKEERKPY